MRIFKQYKAKKREFWPFCFFRCRSRNFDPTRPYLWFAWLLITSS